MAYITPEQARQRFIPKRRAGQAAPSQQIISFDKAVGDKQLLYIIKNETSGVSYLTPADDSLFPIIGEWNDDGNFQELPEVMADWFSCYEAEIEWWQRYGNNSYDNTEENVDVTTFNSQDDMISDSSGKYLISSKWAQHAPYSDAFDIMDEKGGGHWSNTGCNATAASQILYYWWKKGYYCGCRKISGYSKNVSGVDQNGNTKTITFKVSTALPPIASFDFPNMVDTCTSSSNQNCKQAVSTLLLYCAMAFHSNLSPKNVQTNSSGKVVDYEWDYNGATGVNINGCINGWKNSFRINVDGYLDSSDSDSSNLGNSNLAIRRSWGNITDFHTNESQKSIMEIVKRELDNGRPVMMGGHRKKKVGTNKFPSWSGHMFICDGYNAEGKIHINWGYGNESGYKNGWYYPSCLLPSAFAGKYKDFDDTESEAYYSHRKHVIVGIQPRYSKYNISYQDLNTVIKDTENNATVNSNNDIDYNDNLTINDIETLANYVLSGVSNIDTSNKKAFKLASVVSIRKSCREILNSLDKLGYI